MEFFPWSNPQFIVGDIIFWIIASITSIATVATLGADLEIGAAAIGAAAFAGAGLSQLSTTLQPV